MSIVELQWLKIGDDEPILQYKQDTLPWVDVPLVEVPKPPRHWSDVLDVQLDDNREKVEKNYQRSRTRWNGLDQDKVRELDRAWEQYITNE